MQFLWSLCFIIACHQLLVSGQSLADIDILAEIEKLKLKDELHGQLIGELRSTVLQQAEHIAALETVLHDQNKRIELLTATSVEKATDSISEGEPEPTTGTNVMLTNYTNQSNENTTTRQTRKANVGERIRQTSVGPIAFHANVKKWNIMNIGESQHIVFEAVQLNIGNGYHSLQGLFIAPRAGIYCFSTSITSATNIETYLMKNGNVVFGVLALKGEAKFQQGAATSVVQLAAGDEVWVQNGGLSDAIVHGNTFTSFSGFLVHPL